jgi:hypothetical protein
LRAFGFLRVGGAFGFVTTNSIAQGDTRTIGLRKLMRSGACIYAATRSMPWPGVAGVNVARVWACKGPLAGPYWLDGQSTDFVNSGLQAHREVDAPVTLIANTDRAFEGAKLIGDGFILSPEEAQSLLQADPKAASVVRPFLSGQDVNSRPDSSPSRWAINFWDWPLDRASAGPTYSGPVAADYPRCLEIVEERVKPFRMSKPPDSSGNRAMRERWWQYFLWRPALHAAISPLDRTLVRSRVSNVHSMAFVSARAILSDATVVFAYDTFAAFCLLQSRVHEVWARNYGSSMRNDLRYTPTSCFQTFAFPEKWEQDPALHDTGAAYYDHRSRLTAANREGLTATYNRFNNPDERDPGLLELRVLHGAMDRAVLDSYGWTDLPVDCEFLIDADSDDPEEASDRKKRWRYRWPDDLRDEVLARLLVLNAERASEEQQSGAGADAGPRKNRVAATKPAPQTEGLF